MAPPSGHSFSLWAIGLAVIEAGLNAAFKQRLKSLGGKAYLISHKILKKLYFLSDFETLAPKKMSSSAGSSPAKSGWVQFGENGEDAGGNGSTSSGVSSARGSVNSIAQANSNRSRAAAAALEVSDIQVGVITAFRFPNVQSFFLHLPFKKLQIRQTTSFDRSLFIISPPTFPTLFSCPKTNTWSRKKYHSRTPLPKRNTMPRPPALTAFALHVRAI